MDQLVKFFGPQRVQTTTEHLSFAFLGRAIDHFGKCTCVKRSNSDFEYQPSFVLTSTSSLEIVAVYFLSAYI